MPSCGASLKKNMTRMRLVVALAFAACCLSTHAEEKDTMPAATGAIPVALENSVVKVFSTLRRPDPYKPWARPHRLK